MFEADRDPCLEHSAAKNDLELRIGTEHRSVGRWKDELRLRRFQGGLEIGNQLPVDGYELGVAALGGVPVTGPPDPEKHRPEVDVALAKSAQLAFAEPSV